MLLCSSKIKMIIIGLNFASWMVAFIYQNLSGIEYVMGIHCPLNNFHQFDCAIPGLQFQELSFSCAYAVLPGTRSAQRYSEFSLNP
jgi:hypothetical protein